MRPSPSFPWWCERLLKPPQSNANTPKESWDEVRGWAGLYKMRGRIKEQRWLKEASFGSGAKAPSMEWGVYENKQAGGRERISVFSIMSWRWLRDTWRVMRRSWCSKEGCSPQAWEFQAHWCSLKQDWSEIKYEANEARKERRWCL